MFHEFVNTFILTVLLFFGAVIPCLAQKQDRTRIDSLKRVLNHSAKDTIRVNILNSLSEFDWPTAKTDSALYFAHQALGLSKRLGYRKGIAAALTKMGNAYKRKENYAKALKNYFSALKIASDIGNQKIVANNYNSIGIVNYRKANYKAALNNYFKAQRIFVLIKDTTGIEPTYNNIGNVYVSQGNYSKALKNYFLGLKMAKRIKDKQKMGILYENIGTVFQSQGNYPEALKYYYKGLKIHEAINNKEGIGIAYNNIGIIYATQKNYEKALLSFLADLKIAKKVGDKGGVASVYSNLGILYHLQGNYKKALNSFFSGLKIAKEIGDKRVVTNLYGSMGDVYKEENKYSLALNNYLVSLKISQEIGHKNGIAVNDIRIGIIYTYLNQAKKGKRWLKKGLALSLSIGAKEIIKNSYKALAKTDSTLGNYKEALKNYKFYTVYKDSLFNEANTKKMTKAAMQYKFDKKQLADSLKNVQARKLAAEKLEKQKSYTFMGIGIAILLLVFSGLIFRNNKKLSKEKQKSEGLLLNILPEKVSKDLKERGATTAQEFDHVTVLFTDFKEFTLAGERMNSKQLVQELHFCFSAFDKIIDKYSIEKIKTVGDAYFAVSGLPEPNSNHAQDIIKATSEIRDFMLKRRTELGDKTFEVRIGIHSGSVVAGIVGIKKFAYDVWGDTVNTAARMEENGEAGKINISETTYELVKDDFNCKYRGEIEAKNKGKLKMYFVQWI